MSNSTPLRFITYLSPSVPVGLFEAVVHYLEESLGREIQLIYESRWSGPPSDRVDPFTANNADIGVMCSSVFLKLVEEKKTSIEFLELGAVHTHPRSEARPIYFGDIVVHSDNKDKFDNFEKLKGCKWGYNDPESLSGNISVLAHLKKCGTNASFFGHIIQSGSHIESLKMILHKTIDAAAVDSNSLINFVNSYPEQRENLHVMTSLGPFPIYPFVANSRLPAETKTKIKEALLNMHKSVTWEEKLQKYGVQKFTKTDMSLYDKEKEIKEYMKGLKIETVYY
ncbi:unnamed protein product [Owenia fusiformis]|uniref:Uncharacterized protein n=1 Tax=Owenia fusiformis TaxID=6347 RepID=A0A8J1YBV7_OWEFU|nr:unnamed protein product [Owenia fusiformis]